ncbi:MAG: hypothetical protein IH936_14850 [Acidobacteria bacterium]|nr:hypothetical protein [Acidobacteriota bacterium]
MRGIRPSIVFSVGDRAAKIARRIQELTGGDGDGLESIQAFVNIGADGRIVQRLAGKDQELGFLEGLDSGLEPATFGANLDALLEKNRENLLDILEGLTRFIRSKEKISRISGTGLVDSGRNFVYMLADTFGPLASVFPLAFLRLTREHGLGIAKRYPVAFSLFLFLPDLFEEGHDRQALLRSHAMLSDLERLLGEESAGSQVVSWKVWVVGSLDRNGNAVEGYEAVVPPMAHFLNRYLDGALDRDESWSNELSERVNQRQTFLSSFGQADLVFPREHLEETAALFGRRKLFEHLLEGESKVDSDEISGEVQAWIRQQRLTELVDHLRRGEGGRSTYRDPRQPEIEPTTLDRARFGQAVSRLVDIDDPEWGIAVQRAGRDKLEQLKEVFLDKSSDLVDGEGGLEKGRQFADNLAGAGISDALVGIRVLSLENLILKLQGFFAKHADIAGDPELLIQLNRSIPGKVEAIEKLTEKAESEQVRLDELAGRAEEARAEGEAAEEEEPEEPEAEDQSVAEEEPGSADPQDESSEDEVEEPEPEPLGRPGEVAAASAHSRASEKLKATLEDIGKLKAELEEQTEEQAEQTRRIAETRLLACDPNRRDQLLDQILERDEARREEESSALGVAVAERFQTKEALRAAAVKLRRKALIYLLLIPGAAAIPLFLLVVVGWAVWLGIIVLGIFKVLPSWLDYVRAKAGHAETLRSIRLAAEARWRGQLKKLRMRFEFLLYAEATAVLEGMQTEVLDEESRLDRLKNLLAEESNRADRRWAEWQFEDSIYSRTIMDAQASQSLVENDLRISHATREVVEGVSLSQLLSAFRGETELALPAPIAEAEVNLGSRCREILGQQDLGTSLEGEFDGQPEKLANLWRSVQTAAAAWALVDGEPPPGMLRKLVFYPSELSPKVLEDCLRRTMLEDIPVEWIKSSEQDVLSVCEMYVGFPSHLLNELRPETVKREEILPFSVSPDAFVLSLPPGEDEIELPEEEAYALVQAALAHATGNRPKAADTAAKLYAHYKSADFLPDESVDGLLSQLRAAIEAEPNRRPRLLSFVAGLRDKRRLQARKLLSSLL